MTGQTTTAVSGVNTEPPGPAAEHRVLTRVSFRFSSRGSHAACLARLADGPTLVESWLLAEPGPPHRPFRRTSHRPLRTATSDLPATQPLPLEDGRVLLLRAGAGVHRLSLLGAGTDERTLGEHHLAGLRLLPFPGTGALAVAVGTRVDGPAQVWLVTDSGLARHPVASLPGVAAGGCWLDSAGRLLVVNQASRATVRAVGLDLRTGTVTPLPEPATGPARVLLAAPASGLLVCLVTGPDLVTRLGWSTVADPATLRTPEALAGLSPSRVLPLTADSAGTRVAFQLEDALRSRLAVFTPEDGRLVDVPVPPGCLGGVADWSGDLIRMPFCAPASPTGLATFRPGPRAGLHPVAPEPFRLEGSTPHQGGRGWADARVERFAGPAGPVEALVYGDWRRAPRLVVALHGGPDASWRLCFEPLFQWLARSGLAVVAPNQRGSTGYGPAHQRAIHGAWGGPDAADIRQMARAIRAERGGGRLGLFGTSYGGYLALLVAGTQPGAWSRCAVVAPFLSGPRLYAEAGLRVRALVDRLGGRDQHAERDGQPDVLRVADRIRARLLVIHGSADPIIPVTQSRTLRDHLLALGRREPTDFTYLEAPGNGHDPLAGAGAEDRMIRRLCGFLTEGDQ